MSTDWGDVGKAQAGKLEMAHVKKSDALAAILIACPMYHE